MMEDKELAEALNGFDVLVKKGCTCCLYVITCPFSSEIIYDDSCHIHTAQRRWDYLAWEGELPT